MEATEEELVAAFTEWDRRYREDPRAFQSDVERLLAGQTIPTGWIHWRVRAADTISSPVGERFYSDFSAVWSFLFKPKTGVQSINVTPPIVTPYSKNPKFNSLRLSFVLDKRTTRVKVKLFTLEGINIMTLENNGVDIRELDSQEGAFEAVWKCTDWRGKKVPGGAYIYQIEADNNPIMNGTFGVAK